MLLTFTSGRNIVVAVQFARVLIIIKNVLSEALLLLLTSQTAEYFRWWRHRGAGVDQSQFDLRCRWPRPQTESGCLRCGHATAGWQLAHDGRQVSPPVNIHSASPHYCLPQILEYKPGLKYMPGLLVRCSWFLKIPLKDDLSVLEIRLTGQLDNGKPDTSKVWRNLRANECNIKTFVYSVVGGSNFLV